MSHKKWAFDSPARLRQIKQYIPDLFTHKSVLYVGANMERMQFVPEFHAAGFAIDVVEIHKPNTDELIKFNERMIAAGDVWFRNIINTDVRNIWKLDELLSYDVVFWWHGPEHVPIFDFEKTMLMLEKFAMRLIVTGCPWGTYHQTAVRGNPHERHVSHLTVREFINIGYATNTIGRKNVRGSNLLAWKRIFDSHG